MILGWKELTSTFDFEMQSRIRNALSCEAINYKLKTINRTSPNALSPSRRSYTGTVGEMASMYEYIFYVKRRDYDLALHVLPH